MDEKPSQRELAAEKVAIGLISMGPEALKSGWDTFAMFLTAELILCYMSGRIKISLWGGGKDAMQGKKEGENQGPIDPIG